MFDLTDISSLATRDEGLVQLQGFTPRMGRAYAGGRNYDRGPDQPRTVSALSPWIRRRLVTEQEAARTAIGAHGLRTAEKFVSEVVWRTYFKGWLEHRPQVWDDYVRRLPHDPMDGVAEAEAGRTGIPCFDAWAQELVETGYLHNHTRMWFASIWIFTLGLPWRRGADFFLRHLLDGDPASNTCSWRWVAGLHTVGKTYAARSSNITKYTGGRFSGTYGLAEAPAPLDEGGNPPKQAPREPLAVDPEAASLRLITEEDCQIETLPRLMRDAGAATLCLSDRRSPTGAAEMVAAFDRGALADAALRAGAADARVLEMPPVSALIDAAREAGATQIVTAHLPVGWVRDWMFAARPELEAAGLRLAEQRRPWDAAFHPHAGGGFFAVKKKIPSVLASLGL